MQDLKKVHEELDQLWAEADHTNDPDKIRELTYKILGKEKELKLIIHQSKQQAV